MTRLQLRTLVRKRLMETTAAFWTDSQINQWINDACRDLSYRTKCLRSNSYISTTDCTQVVAGDGTFTGSSNTNEIQLTSINTNIYAVLEVYFKREGTNWDRLIPTNRKDMDWEYPGWRDDVGYTWIDPDSAAPGVAYTNYGSNPGVPTHYYWNREENLFGWWLPTDTANTTSNNIHVFYTLVHTDIALDSTGDTQSPTIPEPLQLAIVEFVVATGFASRGWGDKENDAWSKYFSKIKDYHIEKERAQVDDQDIIMKPYRNR